MSIQTATQIVRRDNGSIDTDYYIRRAVILRSSARGDVLHGLNDLFARTLFRSETDPAGIQRTARPKSNRLLRASRQSVPSGRPARHARRFLAGLAFVSLAGVAAPASADQSHVKYSVPAGSTSKAIVVPAYNTPVTMTCVQNTSGFRGVGQATILRVLPPSFLEWVGTDIANGGTVSTGYSSSPGTHIIYCDYVGKTVDLQVNNATSIRIVNTNSSTATGVIQFVW